MAESRISCDQGRIQRKSFARIPTVIDIPNLIDIQKKSYERFLQYKKNPNERDNVGLEEVFKSVFPISDFNETSFLQYVGYEIGAWECNCGEYRGLGGPSVTCEECGQRLKYKGKYDINECRQRGMTYADPLRVMVRLVIPEKDEETGELKIKDIKDIRHIKEQKVYLGEMPLMTDKGTFIINGTERVVVSQLHRSPGVFFSQDKGRSHISGKILYSARIIPYRGSWLDFEMDAKNLIYVRIDRRRKMPATVLLRAFGLSTEDLLNTFYQMEDIIYHKGEGFFSKSVSQLLVGQKASKDIIDPQTGEVYIKAGRKVSKGVFKKIKEAKIKYIDVTEDSLIGGVIALDIVDTKTGEIFSEINTELTKEAIAIIKEKGIQKFQILHIDSWSLKNTMAVDKISTSDEALIEIYKRLRPGDPPTKESSQQLFYDLFFNPKRYDLSKIGRLKLNKKLGLDLSLEERNLTLKDIIEVVRYFIGLSQGIGAVDDIDHLGNRRVRSVGELVENQFRTGLVRMERTIRERMSIQDVTEVMPHDLINFKPVTAAIKEFFGSSQLSQFMDQTNPLSEITHKRRLSALGPGGLTRERAGFEVRDVHPTHYGRVCPVETPEGPNIGLIASLSTYARVNDFGFIEVPYRKVNKGRASEEVEFLSAYEEDQYVIAQANAELDKRGNLIRDLVSARKGGEFIMVPPDQVDYMDVSPKQLVSVAASLIPFLENDDANRALMGSNMQRQAVPLLKTEAPLVGTGMEFVAARDSGSLIICKEDGEVVSVDSSRIVVRRTGKGKESSSHPEVDIYSLAKYNRSNQNTCINQRPIIKEGDKVVKGQVLADGPATDQGDLALGRNILVAFMPWRGYNFEDAV
ncbi:MAG TPA: DNA-directed RNA polymerase subunit beta, partial [Nitrospinota bacterium]|nr:DNA-directed RNA polymerase subunit beta [Nitrospinota bacterium]